MYIPGFSDFWIIFLQKIDSISLKSTLTSSLPISLKIVVAILEFGILDQFIFFIGTEGLGTFNFGSAPPPPGGGGGPPIPGGGGGPIYLLLFIYFYYSCYLLLLLIYFYYFYYF